MLFFFIFKHKEKVIIHRIEIFHIFAVKGKDIHDHQMSVKTEW